MRRGPVVVVLALALALAVSACRAPGEPPAHPGMGPYRDLIRRELDATQSALATSVLLLRYTDDGKVPRAYARVVVRQEANDLRKVAQDLGEITPPAGTQAKHRLLLALTARDHRALAALDMGDPAARRALRASLARDALTVERRIAPVLDPA